MAESQRSSKARRDRRAARAFSSTARRVPAPPLAPGLYVVATPIGNLGDVTLRALAMLAGGGRNFGRGHTRLANFARPLRDRDATQPLPRAQRRRGASACVAQHSRGPGAGAHFGRRNAVDLRSRLQARRRGRCRGARRHGCARRLCGACGALRRGSADRPLLFRRLSASQERGAAGADQRARRRSRHARLLRSAGPASRGARRSRARTRSATRGGGARTDQIARGGPSRRARRARRRIRRRRRRQKERSSSSSARRSGGRDLRGRARSGTSSRRCAPFRSRTPRRRSPPSTACRAGRSMPARSRLRARGGERTRAVERTKRRRGAHLLRPQGRIDRGAAVALKGYSVIARRYAVSGGEIDLIARRGGSIAFVEVKARAELDDAAAAISAIKRRRIARAARVWLSRNPWAVGLTLRGDAVFVAPRRLPRHAPSAYTAGHRLTPPATPSDGPSMPLTVAVQMDPIARIRIAGDSTFALLLEAQARGHRLLHYTPDRLRLNGARVEAMAEPLTVKDVEGDHPRLGEPRLVDLAERRRRAAAAGSALRSRLCDDDPSARAHSPARRSSSTIRAASATRRRSCS